MSDPITSVYSLPDQPNLAHDARGAERRPSLIADLDDESAYQAAVGRMQSATFAYVARRLVVGGQPTGTAEMADCIRPTLAGAAGEGQAKDWAILIDD